VRSEVFRQRSSVEAGNTHDCRQSANRKNHQRKQNPRFELGNFEAVAEGIGDGSKHGEFRKKI
jgi:hypothetical protein